MKCKTYRGRDLDVHRETVHKPCASTYLLISHQPGWVLWRTMGSRFGFMQAGLTIESIGGGWSREEKETRLNCRGT